ncbi:hypothetical protein N8I77_002585 [Diaporthe amygdali]|uniref:Uncharacterized protein n=1 Tax=Phomopsis amygdali TaxID=1214568 RepID=A0AAD9SV42_PHOAM|nr:hypothetical protein N8I77_002585 [Diaporthe amygdali]
MCGRYALALRPSQVRRMLQDDDMPVWDAPADEGDGAPRQSYNFAPGYHGIVYRADVPDWGAGPRREAKSSKGAKAAAEDPSADSETATHDEPAEIEADGNGESGETHYKLQSMKWGLIPFWTKRNPDYGAMMKTINCRDDSLAQSGGMWSSMKGRKRCIVVAQGFYEWLKNGKDKMPHFVKRKDGRLMCFAGLWDCVQYDEGDLTGVDDDQKHYTYTIITTDSNKQLKFLHDRMPVILDPASDKMKTWLDPQRFEWSKGLQDCLKPFDGDLECYPVSKEVGKVGNNSPTFIIPIASKENKNNIANFFANAKPKEAPQADVEVKKEEEGKEETRETKTVEDVAETVDDGGMGISPFLGTKRKVDPGSEDEQAPPAKKVSITTSPTKVTTSPSPSPSKAAQKSTKGISATSNGTKSPAKAKPSGTQKITKFFGNSA